MRGEAIVGELTARQMKLLDLFKGAIERERETQETYGEMLPFNDGPTSNASSRASSGRSSTMRRRF
jgi:hypothetical protein